MTDYEYLKTNVDKLPDCKFKSIVQDWLASDPTALGWKENGEDLAERMGEVLRREMAAHG